jgi:hypothetical protein
LSRECVREAASCDSVGFDRFPSHSEVVAWPSPADEERLHRVALKLETIDDLLDGLLSLDQAVERFETLSVSAETQANLRASVGGDSDGERAVNQVLIFARVRAAQEPQRFAAAIARLESEAKSLPNLIRGPN